MDIKNWLEKNRFAILVISIIGTVIILCVFLSTVILQALIQNDKEEPVDIPPVISDVRDDTSVPNDELTFEEDEQIQKIINDNRREYIQEIQFEIERFYFDFNEYPDSIELGEDSGLILSTDEAIVSSDAPVETIVPSNLVCYVKLDNVYKLGIRLTAGEWFDVGTSSEMCKEADTLEKQN